MNSEIDENFLKQSGIDFAVGAVNIESGMLNYINQFDVNIMDFIIASTAIPFVMPTSTIRGKKYFDGGLRDSAPLKSAIKAGADDIVIVSCAPLKLQEKPVDTGSILDIADRVLSVILNEALQNDLASIEEVNKAVLAKDKSFSDKRIIRTRVIVPEETLDIEMTKFKSKDIKNMIELGYNSAKI